MSTVCTKAHDLDIVQLTRAIEGWPKGTEGTVVREHERHLIIEISEDQAGDEGITVPVRRTDTKIVWRSRGPGRPPSR